MQDHYSTLGLSESASADEIKKAYRKLAMQFHPDKNPGDATAEERFKGINEAYATLSDQNRRAEYDQMRRFGSNPFQGSGFPGGGANEFHFSFGGDQGFDNINDMINRFFRQNGFGDPFGQAHQPRKNRDLQMSVEITLEEAFSGKDLPIGFKANGQDVNIVVRIPAGVEHGTRMRFNGHGDRSQQGLPPGDLYVSINVYPHATFRREGPHLHMDLKVDALEAVVGCVHDVACIDGGKISITIPPGTQHGTLMRIRERGMPIRGNVSKRGDLIICVLIEIPKTVSNDHLILLQNMVSERRGATAQN